MVIAALASLAFAALTFTALAAFAFLRWFGNLLVVLLGESLSHCQHLSVFDLNGHGLRCAIDSDFGNAIFIVTFKCVITFCQNLTLLTATVSISPALGSYKTVVIKEKYRFNPGAVFFFFS